MKLKPSQKPLKTLVAILIFHPHWPAKICGLTLRSPKLAAEEAKEWYDWDIPLSMLAQAKKEVLHKSLDRSVCGRDNVPQCPLKSTAAQIFLQVRCPYLIFVIFAISSPPKLFRPRKEPQRTLPELVSQPLLILWSPPLVPPSPNSPLVHHLLRAAEVCFRFRGSPYTALSLLPITHCQLLSITFFAFFNELSKVFALGLTKLLISPSCSLSVLPFSRKEMVYRWTG